MAARFSQQPYNFYQQTPWPLDAETTITEDDDMSVLDDKILDPNPPEIATISDRRGTFDRQQDDFISSDNSWPDYARQMPSTHTAHPPQTRTESLFEGSNNGFVRLDASQTVSYPQQAQWPMPSSSGSCTPTPVYESIAQEYENNTPAGYNGGAVAFPQMPFRPSLTYAPHSAIPMSPQSSQGWMSAASSDATEPQARPVRSPTYRPTSPMAHMRRDGIRKKNARFEIPAERTLSNIDNLIKQSTDDAEVKELKQQKRLLRNRQAALDSRQRKKQHTEKLEEDKKRHDVVLTDLEDALRQSQAREAELRSQRDELLNAKQQYDQYIDHLRREQDEMIRAHTQETIELRKRNGMLREYFEKMDVAATPGPSSIELANDFSEFDSIALDDGSWDGFAIAPEFGAEPKREPSQSVAPALPGDHDTQTVTSTELPFSWNAFYMCLLFGAFIASNTSSLSPSAIPALSEEYRAESANVLKAVLASTPSQDQHGFFSNPLVPGPSISAHRPTNQPSTISAAEMASITSEPGSLEALHSSLITPSKQQQEEQVFSLNLDQYNALTNTMHEDSEERYEHQPTSLQQALAAMRDGQANANRGAVYSRSLLWDQVPEKVVRDFRRMVRECAAHNGHEERTTTA